MPYEKGGKMTIQEETFGTATTFAGDLVLTQQPYIDNRSGKDGDDKYYALAKLFRPCGEGYTIVGYEVSWEITDPLCSDESDACDWDDYKLKYLGII